MTKQAKLYTSVSKGGEYELVGTSHGAGKLKGFPLMIYRDATTGQMFHREPEEFATRMKAIEPKVDLEALLAQNAKLLAALDDMAAFIADNPHDMGVAEFVIGKIESAKAGA